MITTISNNWHATNMRYLSIALASVRSALEHHVKTVEDVHDASKHEAASPSAPESYVAESGTGPDTPAELPALETLCMAFGLTSFERDVLLLCAGIELDATFAALCAAAQGDPLRTYATFGLALAALPNPHWSALLPDAPLRHWRLLEIGIGNALTTSPLRIDERILHYLTGLQQLDARLACIIEPVRITGDLVPSLLNLAQQIVAQWVQAEDTPTLPVVQLCSNEVPDKRAIAAVICDALQLKLSIIPAHAIPPHPDEFAIFARLWEREMILDRHVVLLDCDDLDTTDVAHERTITRLIESIGGALIVSSRQRRRTLQRPIITFDVHKPTPGEQRTIWQSVLGPAVYKLNGKVEALTSQFNLNASTITSTGAAVLGHLATIEDATSDDLALILWDTCRVQARSHLEDLAQHIEPAASWEDLIVPGLQCQVLHDIAAHVRQRTRVYETWGFAARSSRGLGISALFVGASGTGKTMAAEVLAAELRLDLYRIDLSQVINKYIGETEKNLRRVFDAAEESGAILLFDEADALFGKRSEVKDSHDRYSNIEVSYLLQRMEAYRGLAILTTNMKSALDNAFLRRIRFIVQFPFPDAVQRAEIWRRTFPASTPTEGVDVTKLARLNVTGGNIHNISLNAAFLAADAGEPVRMSHLLRAARSEYAKLEKSLTEAEIGGWV
jgi:hypothetical protein